MFSNAAKDSQSARKRKGRPCDMCRQKKRRCDGNEPCGHCIEHEFRCTYQQRAMHRTTSASKSYVHSLEGRLKMVESLLRDSILKHPHSPPTFTHRPGIELVTQAIRNIHTPHPAPHSEDLTFIEVAQSLQSLSLDNPGDHGFQGKSSQVMLIKAAVDLKSNQSIPYARHSNRTLPPAKPWRIKPWEDPPRPTYAFPEANLMSLLISLYFDSINIFFPLLHRPTFDHAVAANTHLQDAGFGATVLLVCALGALYSDDPRVHLPGITSHSTPGWKWFDQVQLAGHPLAGQPTLYDLQSYCLAIQFLDRASGARACWTLVGFGIRMGEDIGAHRMKGRNAKVTPEEELERRAYWLLVLFDSQFSAALGRTMAVQAHDFDLNLPLQCDDEFWDASVQNVGLRQPLNTPSLVDFFVYQLTLNTILSFAQKILYSTTRGRRLMGLKEEGWQEKVVVELDSALNLWLDSVPAHLRWDPARPDDVFFNQSAALYCSYYLLQIFIHRPFIPAMRHSASQTLLPSLSICNNAARACSHVAEIQQRRRPNNPLVFGPTAVFTSGIVLLLNIWGENRTGCGPDADLSDVHRCTGVLRAYKDHWPSVSPQLDTLEQLLKIHYAPPARVLPEVYDPSPFVTSGVAGAPANGMSSGIHAQPTAQATSWRVDHAVPESSDSGYLDRKEDPVRPPAHAASSYVDSSAFTALPTFDPSQYFAAPDSSETDQYVGMNTEAAAIWSTAPSAFEVSDWDLYLSNLAEMLNGDQPATT